MEIQPTTAYAGQVGAMAGDTAPPPAPHAPKSEENSEKASPDESLDFEQIKRMVEEIEAQVSSMNISLDFTPYGAKNEKMAIVVSNKETGKVIREIPPKELQNLYMKMNELIGILFNRHI